MDVPKTPKRISTMTDSELLVMIHKASAELLRRAGVTAEASAMTARVQTLAPVQTVERPSAADVDFAMYVKDQMRKGGYLKASERERIARIAVTNRAWVESQGLPTTSNAGDWKRAAQYASAPRATERR